MKLCEQNKFWEGFELFLQMYLEALYQKTINKSKSTHYRTQLIIVTHVCYIHSGHKCFVWVACLWSKMPMFQRARIKEGGRGATPKGILIFDSNDMKILWFKFGHEIFTGLEVFQFHFIIRLKNEHPKLTKDLPFWSQWRYRPNLYHKLFISKE